MNPSQTVFLDTSIQIERILGAKQQQREIEHQLTRANCQFVSSHYVFMEFQRSIIADHVHVHNQVFQHDDWEETVVRLRSGVRTYRPRALARMMQIFTRTMVASQMQREIALNLLKVQIERELTKRFWRSVKPLHDPITCDLVQKGSTRHHDGSFTVADSCRKATAACHLPHFLAQRQTQLIIIADYLAAHPHCIKDQERAERILRSTIENSQEALGQSACWPLGDIIIALQVPPDAKLWTLDADMAPLTNALGLALYEPAIQL